MQLTLLSVPLRQDIASDVLKILIQQFPAVFLGISLATNSAHPMISMEEYAKHVTSVVDFCYSRVSMPLHYC